MRVVCVGEGVLAVDDWKPTPTEFTRWFDQRVRRSGLNNREIAEQIAAETGEGISQRDVQRYRTGYRPARERIDALARFFGVQPVFLHQLAGNVPDDPGTADPTAREMAELMASVAWTRDRARAIQILVQGWSDDDVIMRRRLEGVSSGDGHGGRE